MENNEKNTENIGKAKSKNSAVVIVVVIVVCVACLCIALGVVAVFFGEDSKVKDKIISSEASKESISVNDDGTPDSPSENIGTSAPENTEGGSTNNNSSASQGGTSNTVTDDKNEPSQDSSVVNRSASPKITVASQVANGICVVGGFCSKDTEYITVSGNGVTTVKIYPFDSKDSGYFLGQVQYKFATELEITGTEKGKEASRPVKRSIASKTISKSYMETSEYAPYIGKNSQMHFYSALLSYSLSTSKMDASMRAVANDSIGYIVESAKSVGAEPIFLIIPSSAQIYPETVPDKYKKNTGESLYSLFSEIATKKGAKVFYPIDTMKKHREDGFGYRVYPHTDSHWTTYGAYWGTYDMMNYISQKYSAAKPRTLSQMGFYTAEMYGGDALFNFPKNTGFENERKGGKAIVTCIKETVTLYSLKTPTSTVNKVYNSNSGLYLTEDNAAASTCVNPSGNGLPTALIMRDSFGKVCYDMINDRFSTVYWDKFGNYNLPVDKLNAYKPNYVIYIFSERNLLKIMLNNSNANILILQ